MAKRRIPKRRVDHAAEREAWSTVFETGFDFFGDLEPFGIVGDKAAREAAAGAAWKRLGAEFMANWKPTGARDKPWALEEIGEPWKCR